MYHDNIEDEAEAIAQNEDSMLLLAEAREHLELAYKLLNLPTIMAYLRLCHSTNINFDINKFAVFVALAVARHEQHKQEISL